jgi:HEAT repeat protein
MNDEKRSPNRASKTVETHHRKRAWISEAEQLDRLLAAAAKPDCDSETLHWLSWIFGNLRTPEAVSPLLHHLPASPPRTRAAILIALGAIGEPQGLAVLPAYLQDEDESLRRAALRALAARCPDKIDRKLLFADSKEYWSGNLDPQSPITTDQVSRMAETLKLSPEEIRQRYERLAAEFGLKLE